MTPSRGDDGRAAQLDAVADLLPARRLVERARLVHPHEFAHVRARAEVRARAAEDNGAQVAPRRDAREDFAEAFEHRARQGVPLRRAFQADEEERAPLLRDDLAPVGRAARLLLPFVRGHRRLLYCQRLAGTSKS
jgi:hypothetical protein